ncbi:MAG: mechanosensitive ion channel family protein [Gammaproteobacteria bacterium]|nr:MAG: mechanosensitive ion channel family protein [Gammaproteobacteria bacterium]RLA23071.1 MAG: mechanosensitive ion channel family protein [Gammaproteobacteria bacterium]
MKMRVRIIFISCFLLLFSFNTIADMSGLGLPTQEEEVKEVKKTPESMGLASPKETMSTFFSSMDKVNKGHSEAIEGAISTLDLSEVNDLIRKEKGGEAAWVLLEVIDRTRVINLEKVSTRKTGRPWVFNTYKSGQVVISRQDDGRWLFSSETLAILPEIMEELADSKNLKGEQMPWHLKLRGKIPKKLNETYLLLKHWQWIGLFLIIFLGFIADRFVAFLLKLLVRHWKKKSALITKKSKVSDVALRPLGLSAMASLWWAGLMVLGLSSNALVYLMVAVKMLFSLSCVWSSFRLVDVLGIYLHHFASRSESSLDDVLIPLVTKTFKLFISVMGLLFITDTLNFNVTGVLASLGLVGMAFALAAKDMVQNLFGSITIFLDRTFRVGDWIVVGNGEVEGTVEEIGLRSTKIRTFYNSLIYFPNSHFITASVDNMGERHYRRYSSKVSLTYDTPPERIEAFCEGVREIVRVHPYMRKDYYHVYLNEMGHASLDVLVYVFWAVPEWGTELRERHRFLLDILRLADQLGVEFAFPTQTVYWQPAPEDAGRPGGALNSFDQEATFQQARGVVKEIFDKTTGSGGRPPPVTY